MQALKEIVEIIAYFVLAMFIAMVCWGYIDRIYRRWAWRQAEKDARRMMEKRKREGENYEDKYDNHKWS